MKKFLLTEKSHKFETEQHKKKRKVWIWVISILAAVIFLGSVSLFVLLKNYDFDMSNMLGENTTSVTEETSTKAPQVVEGNANILLTLHDEDTLKFVCIVKADAKSKTLSVCSIKANSHSLAEKFKSYDEKIRMAEFKKTVSSLTDTVIDKYIDADYNQFTRAVSAMGSVTMNIPKDISYSDDSIMLSLKKGEWKLIGTNLLNYLLISDTSTQNEIISAIFKEYITKKNVENGESIFKRLVNILDTDITAFDFNSALPALESLVDSDDSFTVTSFDLKG